MEHVIFQGFHGTSKERAELIIENKKFEDSISEQEKLVLTKFENFRRYHWLGDGSYFWDRDIELCKWWVKKDKIQPAYILETPIKCEPNRVFDLNQEKPRKTIEMLLKILLKNDSIVLGNVQLTDLKNNEKYKIVGYIINYYFRNSKPLFDIVYCTFDVETVNGECLMPKHSPQICVKNDRVIEYNEIKVHTI